MVTHICGALFAISPLPSLSLPRPLPRLNVIGLMNCQYAVMPTGEVYIIEANPRASRTVPFVAKAIGHPLATYASLLMSGRTLKDIGFEHEVVPTHVAVKEAVLPFDKFPGCDTLLGPEMRSTGEVRGGAGRGTIGAHEASSLRKWRESPPSLSPGGGG